MRYIDILRLQESEKLSEATTLSGFPSEFVNAVYSKYRLDHDAVGEPMKKKPALKDLNRGVVLSKGKDGNFYALSAYEKGGSYEASYVAMVDGKIKSSVTTMKEITANKLFVPGEYTFIPTGMFTHRKQLRGGPELEQNYFAQMNKTFMPRFKAQIEQGLDLIYGSMRRLSSDHTEHGERAKTYFDQDRTQKKVATEIAETLEKIAAKGFNKETMEEFLRISDKYEGGFGSHYTNIKNMNKLMSEPLGRAKFAKVIYSEIKDLIQRATAMGKVKNESKNK